MTAVRTPRRKIAKIPKPVDRLDGLRVAVLTRISTDEVNQPYSLEAQAAALEAFVASQPGMRITHRFVDQASGATLDRPVCNRPSRLPRPATSTSCSSTASTG